MRLKPHALLLHVLIVVVELLLFLLSASPKLLVLVLLRTALSVRVPPHFVLLPCLFKDSEPIQVFNSNEWLLKVVRLEVVEVAEAEYLLLLQLPHQDFLHLLVSQLAVVVELHGLHLPVTVFFNLDLVFDDFNASFEDTLVFDGLADHNFAGTGA